MGKLNIVFANHSPSKSGTKEIVQTVDLRSGQSLGEAQPDLSPTLDDKHGLVVDTIRFTSLC